MTYTLFLDDIRFPADVRYDYGPYKDLIICRSYHDAVWAVEQYGLPKFIAFDHDLGEIPGSGHHGMGFAKWFCDYVMDNDLDLPDNFGYNVHSANPVGAENIRCYMKNFLEVYKNELRRKSTN